MRGSTRRCLPLLPLLRTYTEAGLAPAEHLGRLAEWGPRFQAVLTARRQWLSEAFLDQASDTEFLAALTAFYQACVPEALHFDALRRRAGMVRHALGHLLRCPEALAVKMERCLVVEGPYHVAGLGPAFWSALAQGLDPRRHPAWLPAVAAGLERLGLARPQPHHRPALVYQAMLDAYDQIRSLAPALTALHIDHFLFLAGRMPGRHLFGQAAGDLSPRLALDAVMRQERARFPLRQRLKERGRSLQEARQQLEEGLAAQDGPLIGAALACADPASTRRGPIRWKTHSQTLALWVGRLWEADDPWDLLDNFWRCDPIPGAGLWLPAAVLHLKQPKQFFPWDETARQGYALLDDSADLGEPTAQRYQLFNEGVGRLCEQHHLHPLEVPALLAAVAQHGAPSRITDADPARFGGFCPDTFRFLEELGRHNRRDWMEAQRDRYRFAVREPLVELCRSLVQSYVEPVLRRQYGWDLESAARSGRALTSICKNDYGRSVPYHTTLWITFYRRSLEDRRAEPATANGLAPRSMGKRDDVQFFVRLDEAGLRYGLRIGRAARAAGALFRRHVQEQADLLYRSLCASGAVADCRFGSDDEPATARTLTCPGDLRDWATGKSLTAFKTVAATDPLVQAEELAGEILLTFDRLLPAYVCAVAEEPQPILASRAGKFASGGGFSESDFCGQTFLSPEWLSRARDLLGLKRQLILQGVPGTGKTHVAQCLARWLTHGRDEAVRLVQFHPAYSYEEFVEGIKVRSVEVDGRHEVTYPVEDGLLGAFAAEAARRPSEPHVLIVDEINRGNLPRIFGELLYLLEYREQSIRLPYSKRSFQLPANLYLLGTMNAADRSVALIDQALRRRFSFLEMAPDSRVLAAWLRTHPPRAGAEFGRLVVGLLDRLNASLGADLGPHFRVGHSYFMVPELDQARLEVVWQHHVQPLLEEYFAGQLVRQTAYQLDQLLEGEGSGSPERTRRRARVSG
jgi:hypothetical protein